MIDIEERDGPDALTPSDWKKLVQMLERAETAQRTARQVNEVLGPDVVKLIMLARDCDGQSLAQIQ